MRASYGTTYSISVWVPPGIASGVKVPALYVLDGDEAFGGTADIASSEARESGLRFVVVGIGYGSGQNMRTRDYTPTVVNGEGGGVDSFLNFLVGQLLPEIEAKYPVIADRADRTISGHSFGGLAVLRALFTRTDASSGFIADSPSLWWDNNEMFSELAAFISAAGALPPSRLYLSVGSHEGDGMEPLYEVFSSRLKAAGIPTLAIKSEVIPNKRTGTCSSARKQTPFRSSSVGSRETARIGFVRCNSTVHLGHSKFVGGGLSAHYRFPAGASVGVSLREQGQMGTDPVFGLTDYFQMFLSPYLEGGWDFRLPHGFSLAATWMFARRLGMTASFFLSFYDLRKSTVSLGATYEF